MPFSTTQCRGTVVRKLQNVLQLKNIHGKINNMKYELIPDWEIKAKRTSQ